MIIYKEAGPNAIFDWSQSNDSKLRFTGQISQYAELYAWAYERCTPSVRKITFENAEVTELKILIYLVK